ncbi:CheR family methyltransferase [Pseudoxanthomonas mexicana]|uniref:CheR family methyltransferase n=1 Tax=Pseudoxanthomonas mexicana TaxID=128785 RepID=UPI001FD6BD57|nr:CheR family methyltransferase [Pseudoxanthomonas mexicana]UOV01948.1 chemotaxis protein CheR [Pseudoxanthomonas mexicana]
MSVSTRSPAPAAATIRRTSAPPAARDDVPASGTRDFEFDDRDFRRVADLIRQRAGIALADGKRDMVYGRLSRRLRALGLRSFKDYLDRLERDGGDEWQAFTNALTTNLTSFFREPHHFERLQEELAKRRNDGPLKIWSCAASTGEEPYSIAITACEAYGTLTPPIRILATDVDTQVLATGERGVYPIERIAGLDDAVKRRYFQRGSGPNEGKCRVHPALRQLIEFRPLNLLAPRYEVSGPFVAMFCRNVMIYFDKPTQRAILTRLVPHLADDGMLYTGHSENYLHAADIIQPCGRTLYRRAGTAA